MFRIETAPLTFPPYQCMVTGREDGEMVVFDADILPFFEGEPPRMTVKREVIEEVGRDLGMASRQEVEQLREDFEEWKAKLAAALDAKAAAEEFEVNFTENLNSY